MKNKSTNPLAKPHMGLGNQEPKKTKSETQPPITDKNTPVSDEDNMEQWIEDYFE